MFVNGPLCLMVNHSQFIINLMVVYGAAGSTVSISMNDKALADLQFIITYHEPILVDD